MNNYLLNKKLLEILDNYYFICSLIEKELAGTDFIKYSIESIWYQDSTELKFVPAGQPNTLRRMFVTFRYFYYEVIEVPKPKPFWKFWKEIEYKEVTLEKEKVRELVLPVYLDENDPRIKKYEKA